MKHPLLVVSLLGLLMASTVVVAQVVEEAAPAPADGAPADGNVTAGPGTDASLGVAEPSGGEVVGVEVPEAWAYRLAAEVSPYQLSMHIATVSDRDNESHRSENVTLDDYGQPRLQAVLFALPFDVTQYALNGTSPSTSISQLMQEHGDALSYVTVRFKTSGEDLTWATSPYIAIDNQTVAPVGSEVLMSTNTQDVVALARDGNAWSLLAWSPEAYADCSQWREDCGYLSWAPSNGIRAG